MGRPGRAVSAYTLSEFRPPAGGGRQFATYRTTRVLKHMAVLTPVSDDDARQLLNRYDIGELVSLRGIAAGIENTNYFLTTTKGEFVLTLFEVLTEKELPFYIELMHFLATRDLPVPDPQTMREGT